MTEKTDFEKAAGGRSTSLLRESLQFLMENKKWWLLPIVLVLLVIGLLVVITSTGAGPFLYTLF
jgi:hypothetical protein